MAESKSLLGGGERPRSSDTKFIEPVDPQQMIAVTFVIRLPHGSPQMPDLNHWQNTPLNQRRCMTTAEYTKTYSATKADLDAVHNFAKSHKLTVLDSHAARRTVTVQGTAAQLNGAFEVTLNNYEAPFPFPQTNVAATTYVHHSFDGSVTIPKNLENVVTAVVGLDNRILGGPAGTGTDPPGFTALPVPTIAQHYNFPNLSATDQVIGVHAPQSPPTGGAAPQGASYLHDDILKSYFPSLPKAYQIAPSLNDINLTVGTNVYQNNTASVNAITPMTDFSSFPAKWIIEVTQDISTSATTAQGATVNVYFTEISEQGYLIFFNRLLVPEGEKQPTVVTSSFANWIRDDASTIGAYNTQGTVANLMSGLLQQLALVGINVFIAAGDSGSGSGVGDSKPHVQYAGSDPWITSCGGTVIASDGKSPPSWVEQTWNDAGGATAGGVSANFPVPSYQSAAGIAQVTDSSGNVLKGRFVPDISGMVACSGFFVHGLGYSFSGTSCVAPLYAGLFASLRNALGIAPGFLNPLLYQLSGTAFNDVTVGNNNNGDKAPYFTAVKGYDACTGLGSVDGTKVLDGIAGLLHSPTFYFQVDKNTFGIDEVTNVSSYPTAFWLVLEGFAPNSLGPVPVLSGSFFTAVGVTITVGAAQAEIQTRPFTPQRILFPCSVTFASAAIKTTSQGGLFPVPGASPIEEPLSGSITVNGQTFTSAVIVELTAGADPYFTNINPSEGNVFYLSQDLRVFTATPGINNTPIPGGPSLTPASNTAQDTHAAYGYIQGLLKYLTANYGNPTDVDPFTLFPGQSNSETADSSVAPSQFNPANPRGPRLTNYNFAIARVRLTGTPQTTSNPVKVFFRLWITSSFDTDYDPTGTYKSTLDAAGLPSTPLTGTTTIPFFATGNYVANADYTINSDYTATSVNFYPITIGSSGSQWAYFGCFLNVYPTGNVVNGRPVLAQLAGTHHCLVAQIAFDQTPIINTGGVTESPDNSDKLAQRNLQITLSDNPGPPSTHIIPQTFDIRPSPPFSLTSGSLIDYPDELMIDWGNTPLGSTASIYWPNVQASGVLALATQLYTTHQLSATDANTIQCQVPRGKTYIPIPSNGINAGENFAGLFTIALPQGVVTGETFDIVVRRLSTRRAAEIIKPPDDPPISVKIALPRNSNVMTNWRYVVGTFTVRIPVTTARVMLPLEEDTLAILKWRFEQLSPDDRWRLVLERYISLVAGRVTGLGGDPGSIKPSPEGAPPTRRHHHHHKRGFWGKILAFCCCGCI